MCTTEVAKFINHRFFAVKIKSSFSLAKNLLPSFAFIQIASM